MSTSVPIMPPTSIGEALRPIGLLTENEFRALLEVVSGPRGFKPTKDEFEKLERSSPLLGINLGYLLAALSYLTSQAERAEEAGQQFDSMFSSFLDELDKEASWGDAKETASKRLSAIFSKRDGFKKFKKLARLRRGFLPNATGFSTFVDIRPSFETVPPQEGGAKQVVDLLTMVQLRITTDATKEAEKEFVVQINEDGLKLLKDAVALIDEKIQVLKSANYLNVKS